MVWRCRRCGNCCKDVGRTFWKAGLALSNFRRFPFLQELAGNGYHEDGGLPCEMFQMQNGVAVCLVEKYFGRAAKPKVCKDHKGDDRCPR